MAFDGSVDGAHIYFKIRDFTAIIYSPHARASFHQDFLSASRSRHFEAARLSLPAPAAMMPHRDILFSHATARHDDARPMMTRIRRPIRSATFSRRQSPFAGDTISPLAAGHFDVNRAAKEPLLVNTQAGYLSKIDDFRRRGFIGAQCRIPPFSIFNTRRQDVVAKVLFVFDAHFHGGGRLATRPP